MQGEKSQYFPMEGIVAVMEPGDNTRYEFMWCAAAPGFVRVAGKPDLAMYEYAVHSILSCYKRNQEFVGGLLPEDEFVEYVAEKSKCSPWTAWAMVQCVAERWHMEVWQ